jgi:hypothetical protein
MLSAGPAIADMSPCEEGIGRIGSSGGLLAAILPSRAAFTSRKPAYHKAELWPDAQKRFAGEARLAKQICAIRKQYSGQVVRLDTLAPADTVTLAGTS